MRRSGPSGSGRAGRGNSLVGRVLELGGTDGLGEGDGGGGVFREVTDEEGGVGVGEGGAEGGRAIKGTAGGGRKESEIGKRRKLRAEGVGE